MTHFETFSDVILFTRGTKGDLYPFLSLGRELQEKGCKVTLLSNFCYENYARQEGFDFVALDDEELFKTLNNIPEFHSSLSSKLELYRNHIIPNLEKELKIIESKVIASNTIIVAHSNDYLSPLLAMEKFNVPLYLCMLAPSYVHGFTLFEAILKNLSIEANEIRVRIGLEPIVDWKKWLSSFKRCFAFWPDWFSDDAKKNVSNLECIGFLSIDTLEEKLLQKEIRAFIGENTKNILITHGTSRPLSDHYFKLGIEVCQKLDCRVIISTPFRELLPEVLPENIIWVDFCPFHELLPLVDLIIHHGGIGTVRESIVHAIPQLIIGQGFDRQHNARVIKKLGLGDWIAPKMLSKNILHEKINILLSDLQIKSKCDKYKLFLCNQDALNVFYESIISQKIGCAQDEMIQAKAAKEIKKIANDESPLDNKPIVDNANISPKRINEIIRDVSNKNNQSLNKQELLFKMLKNKANDVKAQ